MDTEVLARAIAAFHGSNMIYRRDGETQTVASSHGYGHWGDSPERYAERHWREYIQAATVAIEKIANDCAEVADEYAKRAWAAQPSAQEAAVAAEHIAKEIRSRNNIQG